MRTRTRKHIACLGLMLGTAALTAQAQYGETEPRYWVRASTSFIMADDYHRGGGPNFAGMGDDSLASFLFEGPPDADLTIQSYVLDGVACPWGGLRLRTSLVWADLDVDGAPGAPIVYDEGQEFREWTAGLGYTWELRRCILGLEASYTFNEDESFGDPDVAVPVTDGSDSYAVSAFGSAEKWGLLHTLRLAYRMYEESENSPFPGEFELGDRFYAGVEVGKWCGPLYLGVGHDYYTSDSTDGNYLYEDPEWSEVLAKCMYRVHEHVTADLSYQYAYDGSDAPEATQVNIGLGVSL